MEDSKIREAVQYLSEGDKATKKSWFKKPEWDVAGQNYEKAASCFRTARSYDQAIQAYQKASDALFKSDSLYMSAKAMESAANLAAQQLKQPERASEMYKKASDLYQAHMTPDRAGEMLEKAARALEPVSVDSSIEYYVAACNLFESEDRGRFAVDTFKKTIAIMIRNKRYTEAVDIMHRLSKIYQGINNQQGLNKTCLSIIITLLAVEDEVEAKKQFQLFCQHAFIQSEESAVSSSLLDAFEQGDQDLLDQVVRRPIVIYLDNEVAKLSRELQVPGGLSKPLPTTYNPPPEPITSDNSRLQGYEQKNDFPIHNQYQNNPNDSHFLHNQEQKDSNYHSEKSSHDQLQKDSRQESEIKSYIIDEHNQEQKDSRQESEIKSYIIDEHNQEQKENSNDYSEKSSHDQLQKDDTQKSEIKSYIIDEKFEVPPAGNETHLPSSTTTPSHSNFDQNTAIVDENDLC